MGAHLRDDGAWRGNLDILMSADIIILGIESSCDDTSAAVLRNGVLLSNVTASQEVHTADEERYPLMEAAELPQHVRKVSRRCPACLPTI